MAYGSFSTTVRPCLILGAFLTTSTATAAVISNGSGEGDVSITTDEFGHSRTAIFDPVGPTNSGDVFWSSEVLISQGGSLVSIGASEAEILTSSGTQLVSRFNINQLQFTLSQSVADAVSGGQQTGSVFTQSYQIRNLADVTNSFDIYRYLDGDLYLTDDTLADAGGRIGSGANIVLYQTDLIGGQTAIDTFLGITATGGETISSGRFEVAECCGLPNPLSDTVAGDTDGDGIIDESYDVTLSLRNSFSIAPGATATYTTTTLFGNGELPEPGDSESLPLLPNPPSSENEQVDAFVFDIPVQDIEPGETFWIDPIIAVGYTYEVTGAEFGSVTAPSLSAVPDGDGLYTLTVGGDTFTLLAGEQFAFASPVSSFMIGGIDVALELDPADPLAFVTGVSLVNITATAGNIQLTQTPTTFDTDVSAVPLPASALLLLASFGGFVGLRRRKA